MRLRKLFALAMCVLLSTTNAYAQLPNAQPPLGPSAEDGALGFDLDADSSLVAIGPPTLAAGPVARNAWTVSLPVTQRAWGTIPDAIASSHMRISANTLVYHARFRANADRADAVDAWCGAGEWRNLYGWRARPVCVVETTDGQATLGLGGLNNDGPAWYIGSVSYPDPEFRAPRSQIKRHEGLTPTLWLQYMYAGTYGDVINVNQRITGPESLGSSEAWFGGSQLRLKDGEMEYPFGRFSMVLRPSTDKSTVAARWELRAKDIPVAPTAAAAARETSERVAPDKFVIGAARFDPALLSVSAGAIAKRGVIASGPAGHARAGKLGAALEVSDMVKFTAPAGLAMHRFQMFRRNGSGGGYIVEVWCGLFLAKWTAISNHRTVCLMDSHNGGFVLLPTLEEETTLMSTTRFVEPTYVPGRTFSIVDQETPSDTPYQLAFILRSITTQTAEIEINVTHDNDNTRIWKLELPLTDGGSLTLPLWTRALEITRAGDTVSATLVANEDGRGLIDVYPAGIP
jgi:hypothetical protein